MARNRLALHRDSASAHPLPLIESHKHQRREATYQGVDYIGRIAGVLTRNVYARSREPAGPGAGVHLGAREILLTMARVPGWLLPFALQLSSRFRDEARARSQQAHVAKS